MTITANANIDQNYLAHYGVLGMKWGVRKSSSGGSGGGSSKLKKFAKNRADAYVKKREQKTKELQNTTDKWGVAGVAVGRYLGYTGSHSLRAGLTNIINMSANAYIASSGAKYPIARGVDFARRASITALSIKDTADKINAFADVGRAYVHASNKKANKG